MTEHTSSRFGRFVEKIASRIAVIGAICISVALASVPLGLEYSIPLYMAAGAMFLIAQLFIVRWMFGKGMRSTKDLGFGSNRQALKYGLFMQGLDWRLSAVAVYGLLASLVLGFLGIGQFVSGAMLLSFATFGAVAQAMRLNRFWPADAKT
ncbi:MAG: hypothetical protein BGO58_10015 [Sphingopyxis sp. 65-8]|jgi:hypothetical protein|uniref:hypothetical protein n=1 Tax=Sphingopyxis sp. A083 TaxID=1759083 RepID=UPI00073791BC|nr:hypothetical protein [Sphingopyxis sp. A083]KAB2853938.1 MAG: hypothetical protein F9K41_12430 [Sphingopyxis terrae]KTE77793.1 hypothetical protein ATE59_06425 [Sphingopyxis sp. A083]OJW28050.1 MAG: hypothetical protein BGO58_10015 [Sphingopyxis sp. 65-8]